MTSAARPWGFDFEDVALPTTIWQGGIDDVRTPAMSRRTHPERRLRVEPDYATFYFIDDLDAILATLIATRS